MTLGHFVLRNVLRNKRRMGLTVLSMGFSLFLLIMLWTVLNNLINPTQTDTSVRRLAARRSTSLAEQMPVAYGERIKKIPHVQMVMPFQWFGGYYREEKNMVAVLAGDPVMFFQMFPELHAAPATRSVFQQNRRGAVVGRLLMKHFDWKVGDTITIQGNLFPVDLELQIIGDYTNPDQENGIYIRWDYLKEVLGNTGKIGAFWILADRSENVPAIIDAVDATFHNSAAETKTETEKAFMLGFVSMLGNVRLIIGAIAIVVSFAMLLVATSTMAMTIRERMREVAILKSVGFTRARVLALILGEGILLALIGWSIAYAIAFALRFVDTNTLTMGFVPKFRPALWIFAATFGVGLLIGTIAGLIPGIQASRLRITEAMRQLE